MSSVHIDSLRLEVSGISAETANAALTGLDAELRRRLGTRAPDPDTNLPAALRLAPLEAPPRIGAEQLRALIAERLVELLSPTDRARADAGEADEET